MEVIDSSVIFKWFVDEGSEETKKARSIRDGFLAGNIQLLIPDFLYIELANICSFKLGFDIAEVDTIWKLLDKYDIPTVTTDRKLLRKAIDISKKYKISVYDAIYVAVAQDHNSRLITADKKLVKAVSESFVESI